MNESFTIGIVDDHSMVRKGLAILIDLFPRYRVLFDAAGGRDCIDRLRSGPVPDILLMDIVMPEMDGFQTAALVSENYPQIRILALSTMDAETAIIKMIRSGARGYILKDAEPAELKKAFDEVISLGYYYNDLVSRDTLRTAQQIPGKKDGIGATPRLSDRETHFLRLTCSEHTYAEIAKEMFVSERTVDGYRDALFKKLGVSTRVGLVLYAIRNKFVHV
jgi:DNA-binding NarL/FixJ family response regulator